MLAQVLNSMTVRDVLGAVVYGLRCEYTGRLFGSSISKLQPSVGKNGWSSKHTDRPRRLTRRQGSLEKINSSATKSLYRACPVQLEVWSGCGVSPHSQLNKFWKRITHKISLIVEK